MEEGVLHTAGDMTIRAYPSRRCFKIGEVFYSFDFFTAFDSVGVCFEVEKRADGVVFCRRLDPGHLVVRMVIA